MNKEKALSELLAYCVQYKTAIFNSLSNDPNLQMEHMHLKFEAIAYANMASQQNGHSMNVVNTSSALLVNNSNAVPMSNVFGNPSSSGLAHV